jgi:hypothetical protein
MDNFRDVPETVCFLLRIPAISKIKSDLLAYSDTGMEKRTSRLPDPACCAFAHYFGDLR